MFRRLAFVPKEQFRTILTAAENDRYWADAIDASNYIKMEDVEKRKKPTYKGELEIKFPATDPRGPAPPVYWVTEQVDHLHPNNI